MWQLYELSNACVANSNQELQEVYKVGQFSLHTVLYNLYK
jgi:hypothetical protein